MISQQKAIGNKTFLIRKLVNSNFKEGGFIDEHMNKTPSIVNQLVSIKMILDDELQSLLLLSLLDS